MAEEKQVEKAGLAARLREMDRLFSVGDQLPEHRADLRRAADLLSQPPHRLSRDDGEVTVFLSEDEQKALRHEFSEPYGHDIRIGVLGKLRVLVEGDD